MVDTADAIRSTVSEGPVQLGACNIFTEGLCTKPTCGIQSTIAEEQPMNALGQALEPPPALNRFQCISLSRLVDVNLI